MRVLARTLVDGINYIASYVRGSLLRRILRREAKRGGRDFLRAFSVSRRRVAAAPYGAAAP